MYDTRHKMLITARNRKVMWKYSYF